MDRTGPDRADEALFRLSSTTHKAASETLEQAYEAAVHGNMATPGTSTVPFPFNRS